LGHDDAARVSRADIIGWKDALLRAPDGRLLRSQKTVSSKYLASVRTIFGWAERNLRIAENPASKVDVVVPKKVQLREEGLNDAEASVILKAALVAEPDLRSPLAGLVAGGFHGFAPIPVRVLVKSPR
jgi:site-specific recombinase XerD